MAEEERSKGPHKVFSVTDMCKTIERHGIRLTPQRTAIVEALAQYTGIFSVGELQRHLALSNPDLGRATLFRALDLFVRLGVLEKVHREMGEDGYIVGVTGHHHHLICRVCGDVRHIDFCPIQKEIDEIVLQEGFTDTVHRFEIEGICARCREKSENGKGVRGPGAGKRGVPARQGKAPLSKGRLARQ